MRVHHLNCGCMCPLGGRLMDGVSRGLTAQLVCHCLLVEADEGLVLIDTGFGRQDVEHPYRRLNPFFIHFNRIQFDHRRTAFEQVKAHGFSPRDVRHIVLTHLDFDHAGGLEDFPHARVHVLQDEMAAARARHGFRERGRYRPPQWDDVRNWRLYEGGGERWFGFDAVRDLDGLPPEILMIPLPGHTEGHAGVAIDTPEGWLLNAGDAYFHRHEMDSQPRVTPGLAAYQRMMEVDRPMRLRNRRRVHALANDRRNGVRVFCSHDAVELEALQRLSRGEKPM
ncbi:MBL fold metallo-hydrolase [Microvirga pudoricolor]|uniref:MBL fold metallo-hydrolase n=1 Tax=Microvirga pudoricolor TaxID=2778729 RepID=UPI00194FE2A3|nr:MBL fold metallo-hydrolase [Microvirga pudoricolor]MBM6593353.1 MBL fold metallo-hydrolase [Microvirga pudoricolor]